MSRIRGIEVKVQKEILQTRKYGLSEILKRKNNESQTPESKDDVEKKQIRELLQKLPKLDKIFEVHRKIGEGTFSSVYLGSLRQHGALRGAARRWFAIKHLVPTAHPARVEHELRCLRDMGGRNHVIGVDLCLRHLDTIVFIMPYIPHRKFSEYVGEMDASELREYMRALLTALRHVHSYGVIHRDVKPGNFLYDRDNRRYLLVDFGLAQRLCPAPEPSDTSAACESPPAHAAARKRPREEDESPPPTKRAALDLSVSTRARALPAPAAAPAPAPGPPGGAACACAGRGGVCSACAARPAARAARAGTQGYRPPEVLLKVSAQTTAVDMWAAGVVLASALSGRYPFLRAADDVSALAELADLLGTRALARAALALGRRMVTAAPRRGVCLRKLTAHLRAPGGGGGQEAAGGRCARCRLAAPRCVCRDDGAASCGAAVAGFPDAAFALAERLLAPDPRRRISAAEALRHPFLVAD